MKTINPYVALYVSGICVLLLGILCSTTEIQNELGYRNHQMKEWNEGNADNTFPNVHTQEASNSTGQSASPQVATHKHQPNNSPNQRPKSTPVYTSTKSNIEHHPTSVPDSRSSSSDVDEPEVKKGKYSGIWTFDPVNNSSEVITFEIIQYGNEITLSGHNWVGHGSISQSTGKYSWTENTPGKRTSTGNTKFVIDSQGKMIADVRPSNGPRGTFTARKRQVSLTHTGTTTTVNYNQPITITGSNNEPTSRNLTTQPFETYFDKISGSNNLRGTWTTRTIEHGISYNISVTFTSDGRTSYTFTSRKGTNRYKGTWEYSNYILSETYLGGKGHGRIQWLSKDEFDLTILDNGDPSSSGKVRKYLRSL